MSPPLQLQLFRAVFVAFLLLSSLQTIVSAHVGADEHHAAFAAGLALVEIAAAAALMLRRSQRIGAVLLLAVFAIAVGITIMSGENPARFFYYAASALLVVGLDGHFRATKAP